MVYITNNTNFYSTDRHSEYRRIFKCVCVCFDNPINKEKMRATSSNVLAPIVLIVIKKVTKSTLYANFITDIRSENKCQYPILVQKSPTSRNN